MLASTIVDFLCGKTISNPATSERGKTAALVCSITANLGLLGFFKYYMFFGENLNYLLNLVGSETFSILHITLPIGISFYTFQSMSYTIDVYRGRAPAVRSFTDLACFVSLFPQLIAGPIVRYRTIAAQLVRRTHNSERLASGASLFILGFSKKILLANPIGAIADAVFLAESAGALEAWFGVTAYAFQIYFDFSGYSDMALGLGRILGFDFPKNFASPYRAESITEFWRRWHISLSTFLRDYLYIPLGGNRKGPSHLCQSNDRHAGRGALAWGRLDLSGVGSLPRSPAGFGEIKRQGQFLCFSACSRQKGRYFCSRSYLVGPLSRLKPWPGGRLSRLHVRFPFPTGFNGATFGPDLHSGQCSHLSRRRRVRLRPRRGRTVDPPSFLAKNHGHTFPFSGFPDGDVRPGLQSFPLFSILRRPW